MKTLTQVWPKRQVSIERQARQSTVEGNEGNDDDYFEDLEDDEVNRLTQDFDIEGDGENLKFDRQRIDFTHSEPIFTQPEEDDHDGADENEGEVEEPVRKRKAHNFKDTKEKNCVGVHHEWRVFKLGESFALRDYLMVGDPDMIFTIQEFFEDGCRKMARCHVLVLTEKTFIGKGNDKYEKHAVEAKLGKYVQCRYSQNKPLRELVHFRSPETVPKAAVYFDASTTDGPKGPGWTVAYSFKGSFDQGKKWEYNDKPTAIDLFAGAGGMSIGLQEAGFAVKFCVEKEPMPAATLRCNHGKDTIVFDQTVESFIADLKNPEKGSPYESIRGSVMHGHASSPCQGFSPMNSGGLEQAKEANNKLCETFPEIVISAEMKSGTFENVPGMLQQKRRHYLQNMLIRFIMHDYEVRVCVVDSARYGDPQSRKRIIVFVSQKTFALPELPPPTHGPGLIPFVTARDVIGDLEQILPRKEAGLIRVPKSDVFVNHHIESNQDEKKEQRLKADEPGHAILCGHAVGHYEFDRPCTNLECARLQGFPDDHEFQGSQVQIKRQIGNAVPIGLATAVAKAVMDTVYKKYTPDDYFPDDSFEDFSESPVDTIMISQQLSRPARVSHG